MLQPEKENKCILLTNGQRMRVAAKANLDAFIAEQKAYQKKAYRKAGFRWPHLDMFNKLQE